MSTGNSTNNRSKLQTAKINDKVQLLNMDDHEQYLQKTLKKDPTKYRPDILHRCMLAVYDSPLAKATKLMVYIHTTDGAVIEISPEMRVCSFGNPDSPY